MHRAFQTDFAPTKDEFEKGFRSPVSRYAEKYERHGKIFNWLENKLISFLWKNHKVAHDAYMESECGCIQRVKVAWRTYHQVKSSCKYPNCIADCEEGCDRSFKM